VNPVDFARADLLDSSNAVVGTFFVVDTINSSFVPGGDSGFRGMTGFRTGSVTVPSAGTYTIRFVVSDVSDTDFDSALVVDNIRENAALQLVISEFRLRGPNGANDEFIEIYNNSDSNITATAFDGSAGLAVVASDGTTRFVIPNNTIIPARGHFLGVNSVGYSLALYPATRETTATGDATYTSDIPDNAGIALFNSSNPLNFTLANRLDAIGSTSEANTLYKEGAGYPALTPFNIDYSFFRRLPGGCTGSSSGSGNCNSVALVQNTPAPTSSYPQDTNDNASDFLFVYTDAGPVGAGQRTGESLQPSR
jgi:hypothetical protein